MGKTLAILNIMTYWQEVQQYVGIDEVGRGPVAGPLLVAGVVTSKKNKKKTERALEGIRDSKKLSERQRENWFDTLCALRERGLLDWRIAFVTPRVIDRDGIAKALGVTVARVLTHLEIKSDTTGVLLDGSLYAPVQYIYQETIVGGDERERLIAAASVIAKVSRDRRMQNYAARFPEYSFDTHKGYGTKEHMRAIKKYGTCELHRISFIH